MFNSIALEVVIGLVFIYLLYSLLVTIIQEIIANKLSYRAKFLEKAIIRMLEDGNLEGRRFGFKINPLPQALLNPNNFSRIFYNHPLIKYLGERSDRSKPSYLSSESFSKIIIDILRGQNTTPGQEIRSSIQATLNTGNISWNNTNNNATQNQPKISPETLLYLNSIWADSQGDVERFRELLENWFNETMDRATGWYKKYTQFISFSIGLIIAIAFNVDTIQIAHKLERDPTLRAQIIQQADAYVKAHPNLTEELKTEKQNQFKKIDSISTINDSISINTKKDTLNTIAKDSLKKIKAAELDTQYNSLKKKGDSLVNQATELVQKDLNNTNELLGMGIGSYKLKECKNCTSCENITMQIGSFFRSFFGWIITALALSLGAPFWFDLLNKLMKLRTSVAPSSPDNDKKKKDATVEKIKRVG